MSQIPNQPQAAERAAPDAINGEGPWNAPRNGEPGSGESFQSRAATNPTARKRRSPVAGIWYSLSWCAFFAIGKAWFRFRFTGKHSVPPDGPILLVSNHQSHLDPVLVGVACPRQLKYLARQSLFFWPLGLGIRSLGAVPIDRSRGALGGIRTTLKLLKDGEAVLVFPEGSRSYDGQLQPFLSGFCMLARRSGATIVPVAIDGAFRALPRGSVFARPEPISLRFCAPIAQKHYAGLSDEELARIIFNEISGALESSRSVTPD